MTQLTLYPPATGPELRDKGIRKAESTAERNVPGWSEMALDALKSFISIYPSREFQTEDVRQWAHAHGLPDANGRAWGAVVLKAKREGLIRSIGIGPVSNKTAHCAFAARWVKA